MLALNIKKNPQSVQCSPSTFLHIYYQKRGVFHITK